MTWWYLHRRVAWLCCALCICLGAAAVHAGRDSVGSFCDYALFEGERPDTIGWELFNDYLQPGSILTDLSPPALARHIAPNRLMKLVNPSALTIALCVEHGLTVVCLNRYHAEVTSADTTENGMVFSDAVWEQCDSVQLTPVTRGVIMVELCFGRVGCSLYQGTVPVQLHSRRASPPCPALVVPRDDQAAQTVTVQRQIQDVYILTDSTIEAHDLAATLEARLNQVSPRQPHGLPDVRHILAR